MPKYRFMRAFLLYLDLFFFKNQLKKHAKIERV